MVGADAAEWIVIHIVLDSLLFLRVLPDGARAIMDLGSGAGVPGIPLRIVRPELQVTFLEARQRRASFLAEAVRELGLSNCRVVPERAEAAVKRLAGQFEAVLMRCAGEPKRMVPLAMRFLQRGGVAIVSGPPRAPGGCVAGSWVETSGLQPDEVRRFLVQVRPMTP